MEKDSLSLSVLTLCGTEQRSYLRFYELLADVLQSITASEQLEQAA